MHDHRQAGAVVTLICDSGDRYADTYFNDIFDAETMDPVGTRSFGIPGRTEPGWKDPT